MTKKERAKRLQALFVELLMPKPGEGELFVDVQALGKDCLHVGVLRNFPNGGQVFFEGNIRLVDIVRQIHDLLLTEPPEATDEQPR